MERQNARILIVDDSITMLAYIGVILRNNQYEFDSALNGDTAINKAETQKFDLILLDVILENETGFDVLKRIKANERIKNIPVIFLTIVADTAKIATAMELGAVDYIAKPFSEIELLARIKTHLELQFSKEKLLASYKELLQFKYALDETAIVAITDKHGKITYANDKFCKISKYSLAELIGNDHRIINSGYHSKFFFKNLWETIKSKRIWKGEIQNRAKDGELYWVDTIITHLLDPSGNINQFLVIRYDITKHKKSEAVILEQEKKFISIFDNMKEGCQIISHDWRYVYVNTAVASQGKYKIEELLGRTMMEMYPGIENTDLFEKLKRCMEEKINDSFENRFTFPDGSIGGFRLSVQPIEQGIFILSVDITTRLQAEEAVQISQQRLDAFVQASTDSISIYDSDLIMLDLNKACLEWMPHLTREEIIGKHMLELAPGLKETQRYKAYQNVIQTGESFISASEVPAGLKPGVEYIIAKAFKVGEGMGLAITDVTESKRLEKDLRDAKIQADAANKAKSDFLASMSHEIRTPLNGVIGFSDLLMKTKLNETQSQYMEIVHQSANSLLDLLNDILDFSKIEAGKLELNTEEIDIFELVGQASDVIKYKANEKKLEVLLNISPYTPRFIFGDPIRLRQILVNLIGNAVKFTEAGEIEIKVEVLDSNEKKVGLKDTRFQFSVRDTGIGISKENQKKIFEAFAQEDSSTTRKYGGTGLGLAISDRLLALMNSKLELESQVGMGSRFYFTVVLIAEEGEKLDNNGLENIKNVLIVDDNQNNRIILQDMLLLERINSDLAHNGLEALNKIKENSNYDAIIMDYHMPDMDGLEVIRKIRSDYSKSFENQPIVLLHSSSDDEGLQKACQKLAVHLKILKPIKVKDLFAALGKIKSKKIETNKIVEEAVIIPENSNPHSIKVLIVDDDKVNRLLAHSILNQISSSFQITEAHNGLEAIEQFQKEKPDIIFMDVQMPEMNGFEATIEIRKLEMGRQIPIVALTAGTVKEEIEKCFVAGMSDYASKPVIKSTFEKILEKWLGSDDTRLQELKVLEEEAAYKNHFDFIEFKARFSLDDETLNKILSTANSTFASSLIDLKKYLKEKDLIALHSTAHKIKGAAITICCAKLNSLAIRAEEQNQFDEILISKLVQEIENEISLLLKLITRNMQN